LLGRDAQILRHFCHGSGTHRPARPPRPATDDKKSLRVGLMESGCVVQAGPTGGVEVPGGTDATAQNNDGSLWAQIRGQPQGPCEDLAKRIEAVFQSFFAQTLDLAFEPTPDPDFSRAVALPSRFSRPTGLF
jgi:hypothetical protein